MNSFLEVIKGYLSFSKDRTVVIYGMGTIGKLLFDEIKLQKPVCIDNYNSLYDKSQVLINNTEKYYIIVTPLNGYADIAYELQQYGYKEIRDFICLGKLQPIHDLLKKKGFKITLKGNYSNWEELQEILKCEGDNKGYAENNILNSVLETTQAVRDGKAEYERDSVPFYERAWNYQFLSSIYYITQDIGKQKVSLLDFGGALGSTFFQHRTLLKNIDWNIIEQEGYVNAGRQNIPEISFYHDVQEYIDSGKDCDVLNLSGVLMYLPKPYSSLEMLLKKRFRFVIVDRTYFNVEERDRLCIQTVPDEIYHAIYPAWLFSETKVNLLFEKNGYKKVMSWFSTIENEEKDYLLLDDEGLLLPGKGMLYILNN